MNGKMSGNSVPFTGQAEIYAVAGECREESVGLEGWGCRGDTLPRFLAGVRNPLPFVGQVDIRQRDSAEQRGEGWAGGRAANC